MRVPYHWLQELTPVLLPAAQVAERLTMAGFEVEEIFELEGETVMDIKVNSNRGDGLSMVGIAREVAALTRGHVVHPPTETQETGEAVAALARVIVEAPDLCPRYAARVIRGVTIGPSPEWAQRRLTLAGVRPINNVVDATNYVMLEMGQPLHAFDLSLLADHTIVVRRARDGETMTTLDEVEHTLTSDMLVIADPRRAIALAGIMGGANTQVSEETTDILLESAHFERRSIRRTARANQVSSESSYRFERIVDPGGTARAADRAARLIAEWAGGAVAQGIIDIAEPMALSRVIALRPARVNAVLGTDISREDMLAVLRGLELIVHDGEGVITVTAPSFRPDLVEEMDLIEEVARIYGYQFVPTTVPGHITGSGRLAPELAFEDRLRELLTAAGLFEGLSYSLIDYRLLDLMLLPAEAPERTQIVALLNPKSEEYTHLRPSIFVSLLESLRNNARRNIENVQVFELGRIFRNTGGGLRFNYAPHERRPDFIGVRVQGAEALPLEQRAIGIAVMGRPWTTRWGGGEGEVDFFWLKGIVEQLLTDLAIENAAYVPARHPSLHPGRAAEIQVDGRVVGLFGEAHPQVARNFDLPGRACLAEINADALMDYAADIREHPRLSRFPAVDRDVSFLAPEAKPADHIQRVIREAAGPFVESVELFDVYQGANIPEGWRSLAYRITFRAEDRTLADDEADAAMRQVRGALADEVGATIR